MYLSKCGEGVVNLEYFVRAEPLGLAAPSEVRPPIVEITMLRGSSFRISGEPAADFLDRVRRIADATEGTSPGGGQIAETTIIVHDPEPDAPAQQAP